MQMPRVRRHLSLLFAALMLCHSATVWAIDPPHEQDCANCHIPHHAAGAAPTAAAGNANLCMTCHNPVGVAWPLPFAASDQAAAGTRGTSHRWDSGVAGYVEADPTNTSSGAVQSGGAFSGRYSKTYTITITEAGDAETARFSWTATAPGGGSGIDVQAGTGVALDEGVTVSFANAAVSPSFRLSDRWRVVVTTDLSQPASATLRLVDGRVVCSTCHDQHSQQRTPFDPNAPDYGGRGTGAGRHFQRLSNETDQMCRDCHRKRDVADASEGSHPVGIAVPSDPAYRTPLGLPLDAAANQIECQTCHGVHFASSGGANGGFGDGYLLNRSLDQLCNECHVGGGDPESNPHLDPIDGALWPGGRFGSTFPAQPAQRRGACTNCHWPHGWPNDAEPNADYPMLLVDRVDRLCLNCHDNDESHTHGQGCLETCHGDHSKGFAHGGGSSGAGCAGCHGHDNGWNGASYYGTTSSHSTHTDHDADDLRGPELACDACHDSQNIPYFRSGIDGNGDGRFDLTETDVCDTCHSPGGDFDGVSDAVVGAKLNWPEGIYDGGALRAGRQDWCVTCHDQAPSAIDGHRAANKIGDGITYGYYVTGHGRTASYPRMSWQATAAAGNPGAGKSCSACHDSAQPHIAPPEPTDRLIYPNDQSDGSCVHCHDAGGSAVSAPQFYVSSAAFESSAHADVLCSACHDVHGSVGDAGPTYSGMTKGDKEALCYQCHTTAGVRNEAISGASLATNIQQAFGMSSKHQLGAAFNVASESYALQCTSCHNVHVVTGKYWQADQGKSPVTRFTNNLAVWGAAGQKMGNYGGTYRTPAGDRFSGSDLPDYATFCLDCHARPQSELGEHGGISWGGDDPHGLNSANSPNGGGTCPDWFACGNARGWEGDDCTADQAECWPVIPSGKGDELYSRNPYRHEERIAGANFVLSCTDCHEAHGSTIRSMIRPNPNGGVGSTVWNNMCNSCHYYYSEWHAGMSCASVSCHGAPPNNNRFPAGSDSIHGMGRRTGSGATRNFDPGLVLDLRFEGNLNDSGGYRLHSKWYEGAAGSFSTGRSGQAIALNGDQTVQVGTRNDDWSTDEGKHGTWKYTEMKYHATLEAWVYPTSNSGSEYSIFTKHVGYSDGGYALALTDIDGSLRAAFSMQADDNGGAQDGASGVRGAYSSVSVPLHTWTHVAASFDTAGLDRDPNQPATGRIRIWVNGEDVTTSDVSGNASQPGQGETSIYAYAENSPWNQAICYDNSWCASEFSVGGFTWQNGFIGRIDDAKVWNLTKTADYFAPVDQQSLPRIDRVVGVVGSNRLTATFSEGVFASSAQSGALQAGDFMLVDADNARTVVDVDHTAGNSVAVLTLSSALDDIDDIDTDTLAAATAAIFDDYGNAAAVAAVVVAGSSQCPLGQVIIDLNETPASTFVLDTQGVLSGKVSGSGTLTGAGYSGGGDGSGRYIDFENNDRCLKATTAMTLAARLRPSGLAGVTGNYVRRVLARDGVGNYQMTVWRIIDATNYPGFNPPVATASIALWVRVADNNGGDWWKPVLTDYSACPIVSDHWYQVTAVWNTDKPGGIPAQPFVPADIFVDDQGTDGAGAGENWSGSSSCAKSDQSYLSSAKKLYTADRISEANGDFVIGANVVNHANNLFDGLVDWISWKASAD